MVYTLYAYDLECNILHYLILSGTLRVFAPEKNLDANGPR